MVKVFKGESMQINIVKDNEKVLSAGLKTEKDVKENPITTDIASIGEETNQNIRTEIKSNIINKKDDKDFWNFRKKVEEYSNTLDYVAGLGMAKELENEGISKDNSDAGLVKKSISHIIEKREFNREMVKEQRESIKEITEIAKKIATSGDSNVIRKLENSGMAVTKENVELFKEVIFANDVTKDISDSTIRNMIEKDNTETAANIYLANHSGEAVSDKFDEKAWKEVKAQAEELLINNGVKVDEESITAAKWLFNHKIEITPANVAKYLSLTELKKNADTIKGIANIAENFMKTVSDGRKISDVIIGTANKKQASYIINWFNKIETEVSIKDIKARRNIEEIRLKLTEESLVKMLNKGIKIDTSDLKGLVENLKNEEDSYYKELLEKSKPFKSFTEKDKFNENSIKENGNQINQIELLKSTCTIRSYAVKMSIDSNYKIGAISATYKEETITFARYHEAGLAYEKGETEIRADLGDSIKKAFGNIDEVLKANKLEITEMNKKAVRLLAYNRAEVSAESVTKIKRTIALTETTLNELKPATIARIIKSGKNPLDMSMSELLELAREINKEVLPDEEKYSRYLYNLEKNSGISQPEREAYIGIYRILSQIEKGDYASVGSVSLMEQELTLRNLLAAVRTIKTGGFDKKVNEDFGELIRITGNGKIDNQIDTAYAKIIAGNIKDSLSEADESYNKESELIKEIQDGDIESLIDGRAEVTVSNFFAQMNINKGRRNLLGLVTDMSDSEKKELNNLSEKLINEFNEISAEKNEKAISEVLNKKTSKLINRDNITYTELNSLINIKKTIALSNKRTETKSYDVPFIYDEDKLADLSITIRKGRTEIDKGKVAVKLTVEDGEISSEFRIAAERITGYFRSDSREKLEKLKSDEKKLKDNLSELNTKIGEISYHFGIETLQSKNFDDIYSDVPIPNLYKLGKVLAGHILKSIGISEV